MNVSITNECNRRCEYCFQKSWYLAKDKDHIKEMSVDTFKEILTWCNSDYGFNILGGEPLLHSNINDILIAARDASKYIVLITNLIVPYEKISYIVDNFTNKPIFNWLLNTDYFDTQEKVFLKNISILKDTNITLSVTLLPDDKKIKKSLSRMNTIIGILKDTNNNISIRISPTTPNYLSTYNNKFDYTKNIIKYIDSVWKQYKKCSIEFDCHINYCEIDVDQLEDHFGDDAEKYLNYHTNVCDNGAIDILVDNSVIWCSSCKHIKVDDFRNYDNLNVCRNELYKQWKQYWKSTKLKCNYQICDKFNPAKCSGLCAGRNYIADNYNNEGAI